MKAGWQLNTFSEIFEKTETVNPLQSPNDEFDYIDVSSVSNTTFLIEETQRLKGKDAPSRARKQVRTNDIIFATIRPTLQRIAIVPEHLDKQVCSTGYFVIRPKAGIDHRFVFYFLLTNDFTQQMEKLQKGASYPAVTDSEVKAQIIPLPLLPEQHRIVAILDEAFENIASAKANAEQNLKNARDLFESHLQAVFTRRGEGWVIKRISEVSKHSLGKMLDKAKNKGSMQPYLRNINVRWFNVDLSDVLEMPFLPEETEKYTAIKGDVLICEGGYPGRASIWDEDYPIYFQKALHRVRFHHSEYNKWFVYYLYSEDTNGTLKKHFNGAGIQHFTGEALARFEVPLPPLQKLNKLLERFDALFSETQRLESIYKQKIAALDELKKALLHKAFSGEL